MEGTRTQQETLADWGDASLRGRWVRCRRVVRLGVESRAAVPGRDVHCPPMANPWEDAGWRRAERVSLPAREKNRRRSVLVVTIRSPRPIRAVQRARLCAITCIAS